MSDRVNQSSRRQFLAAGTAAGLGLAVAGSLRGEDAGAALGALAASTAPNPLATPEQTPMFKKKIRKGFIGGPDESTFKQAKEHGFDCVQIGGWNYTPDAAKKAREEADKHGIKISSLIRAWVSLDSPDEHKVDEIVKTIEVSLLAAQGFGCTNILLVPANPPKCEVPHPLDFDIEMDDKGIVSRVVKGDNTKFKAYIEAQNRATTRSWEVHKRLTPIAEKTGVVIALENVWNNLWVRPDLFKKFVDGHNHPMVRPFFDNANHVKYGIPPETWIRTLGKSIMELHIKEYRLKDNAWTNLREGGINWPEVRKALDEVGFEGVATIEKSGAKPNPSLADEAKQCNLILEGK